jgi:hypothetical protein
MSKNPVEISNCISLVYMATKEMARQDSQAPDAGTPIRNAKLLLTKVVNKLGAAMELQDVQAGMMLLK